MGSGVFGLVAAALLWIGHRHTLVPVMAWAVLVTVTAGLAPVVWGGAPIYSGVLAAAFAAAIAALVVWMTKRALRGMASG